MRNLPYIIASAAVAVAALLLGVLYWGTSEPGASQTAKKLTVYVAAGLREPMEQIARDYEQEFGVQIAFQFNGSGALLSSIRAADEGDLFVPADLQYAEQARAFERIDDLVPIASQTLVIGVRKGNPKKISSPADLLRDDVRVSLPSPKVAAAGKVAQEILSGEQREGKSLWSAIEARQLTTRDTVNAVANDLKTDTADAAFLWDATADQYPELEAVRFAKFDAKPTRIVAAVLTTAKSKPAAWHFARYLSARDRGLKTWASKGYKVVEGDAWADRPEITLFSGGVMRPAVEQLVADFESREGVDIVPTFNGCGILLGQIKTGASPDIYFACDTSFLQPVAEQFRASKEVSDTKLCIITAKGNPKRVNSAADLAQPGLKVGICRAEHSACGYLTKQHLDALGLWDAVQPNVTDTPATADRLVEHVVIGSMEAAIVYVANTTRQLDKLEVIPLEGVGTTAVQPIAIASKSKYPELAGRLERHLRAAKARQIFEQFGFHWRGEKVAP